MTFAVSGGGGTPKADVSTGKLGKFYSDKVGEGLKKIEHFADVTLEWILKVLRSKRSSCPPRLESLDPFWVALYRVPTADRPSRRRPKPKSDVKSRRGQPLSS